MFINKLLVSFILLGNLIYHVLSTCPVLSQCVPRNMHKPTLYRHSSRGRAIATAAKAEGT
jgi:hypothetical protein